MPETLSPGAGSMGFFGKMPSHGDFVSRHLPRSFTDPWDSWLQAVIANSHEQLDGNWLNIYLTSPIWRFALSPGLCGEKAWTGLLMPSVDSVGRYFPLTLAVPLRTEANLMRLLTDTGEWFSKAEELALSALQDGFDIESFSRSIKALQAPMLPARPERLERHQTSRPAWQVNLSGVDGSRENLACIGQILLDQQYQAYSLWWTQGSERLGPSLLINEGLPPVSSYSGLLDGDWIRWGWGQYRLPQEQPNDSKPADDMAHPD